MSFLLFSSQMELIGWVHRASRWITPAMVTSQSEGNRVWKKVRIEEALSRAASFTPGPQLSDEWGAQWSDSHHLTCYICLLCPPQERAHRDGWEAATCPQCSYRNGCVGGSSYFVGWQGGRERDPSPNGHPVVEYT